MEPGRRKDCALLLEVWMNARHALERLPGDMDVPIGGTRIRTRVAETSSLASFGF